MRYKPSSWTNAPCLRCHAKVGEPCVTITGKRARDAHSSRVRDCMMLWYRRIEQEHTKETS